MLRNWWKKHGPQQNIEAKKEEEFKAIVEQLEKTQRKLTDSREPLREALRALG